MEWQDVQNYLNENKDNEDIISGLQQFVPQRETELDFDKVRTFIESKEKDDENIQKFLSSKADSRVSQAIETFKKGKMEEEFKKRLEAMGQEETEEQKTIRELKEQLEQRDRENLRTNLTIKAKDFANSNGLPSDLVNYFLGNDENETMENLKNFKNTFSNALQKSVNEVIKSTGYTPEQGGETKTFTDEEIANMSVAEINANWDAIKKSRKK
jgi:restriction endonuclease Mrr